MEFDKIIENLPPEIFTETYSNEGDVQQRNTGMSDNAIYDEPISKELAQSLIPKGEYDSTCEYVLSQSNDAAVVIKRRDGEEPILQEYALNTSDTVQSLGDMWLDVQRVRNGVREDALHVDSSYELIKPKPWFVVPVVILAILLFIGLYIFVSLVR